MTIKPKKLFAMGNNEELYNKMKKKKMTFVETDSQPTDQFGRRVLTPIYTKEEIRFPPTAEAFLTCA